MVVTVRGREHLQARIVVAIAVCERQKVVLFVVKRFLPPLSLLFR